MKRKRRQKPEDVARLCIKDKVDLNQFYVKEVPPKGRGVFTSTAFAQDEFLLQYYGKLCTWEEGDELEKECSSGYRFFLTFRGQRYCIDATEEPTTGSMLGRLVNHGSKKEVNVKLSVIDADGAPALCLFACRTIQAGEELLYNYGVKGLPWEKKSNKGQELRGNVQVCKESRWSGELERIQTKAVLHKQIGRILFSKSCKIADGSNGTQIYVGLLDESMPVAVKRIPTEFAATELKLNEILCRESLKNFILPTLATEEDDDFKYLASPLCECNLEELIENGYQLANKFSKTQMCYQLILGLHHLLKMNILHRDLKPSNVLLDSDGNVLLGDFGISRKLVGTTLLTKAVGTICWMSAESSGQQARYKKSSDIQMMGCLLYYIFTNGHIPHESTVPFTNQPEGVMANMRNNKYSLCHLESVYSYFKPLLQRMLAGDEKLRPSIEECMKYFEASPESGMEDSNTPLALTLDESRLSSVSSQLSNAEKTVHAYSFVSSCVRKSQKCHIERLADLHGCYFTHEFNSSTTHVIIKADEDMVCERTLKYLQGIASKIWVVSHSWVESSLEKGMLLPERDFEIKGETVCGVSFGPALSRRSNSSLLHGYTIDVLGKSNFITKDEVLTLSTLSGASVNGPLTQTSAKIPVTIILEEANQHWSNIVHTLEVERGNELAVQLDWLLDCICTQTIKPLENYMVQLQLNDGCLDEVDKVDINNAHSVSGKVDNVTEMDLPTDKPFENDDDRITGEDSEHPTDKPFDNDDDCITGEDSEHPTDKPFDNDDDRITGEDSEHHSKTEDHDKDDPAFEEISDNSGESSGSEEEEEEDAEENLHVKTSKKKDGKRILDKYHVCFYCETKQTHVARHLSLVHPDEIQVAEVLAHEKGSTERKRLFKLLVNKGDRVHNFSALEKGKGILIPRRQPPKKKSADDYLFCNACSGLYLRSELWRHQKFCFFKKQKEEAPQSGRVQNVARNLLPVPKDITEKFWKIVCDMKPDDISNTVKKEGLILKFGEQLFKKHGKVVCQQNNSVVYDASNSDYIREKMRELGRLSLAGQRIGLLCIEDFVMPKNFQKVVKAVQEVAGFDCNTMMYKTPSLVLKCGHNLQAVSDIVLCQASIANDEEKVKQMEQFQKIYKRLWNPELSSVALTNIRESKWNKPVVLPTAKDIQILNNFLNTQIIDDEHALKKEQTLSNWISLVEKMLAYVIVFNRRRVGETSKLLLKTYETKMKEKTPVNEDVAASLTSSEVKLCEYFTRIEIRGKRGRQVPILLSPLMVRVMKVLTDARRPLSINNPYFFANPNSSCRPHLRGSDCVRKYASECGASVPLSLRSTLLRKHLGTTCQILNMTSTELEGLARFMGHDIHVHESFYRLQEGTIQAAKISKILLAMESGQISLYKGKTLDEIDPNPDVIAQEESDDDEDDDDPDYDNNEDEKPDDDKSDNKDPSYHLQIEDDATDDEDEEDYHDDNKSSVSSKRKKVVKIPWTPEETAAVQKHFMSHIRKNLAVKKHEAMDCLCKEQALCSRDWKAVKFKVKNMAVKYQKQFPTNSK